MGAPYPWVDDTATGHGQELEKTGRDAARATQAELPETAKSDQDWFGVHWNGNAAGTLIQLEMCCSGIFVLFVSAVIIP